jgi:hypothetical protein
MKIQNKSGRLEKITSSVKSAGKSAVKSAGNFLKDNAKYAVMTGALALGGYGLNGTEARGASVPSPGYLKITNNLNSHSNFVDIKRNNAIFPGATDGYDLNKDSIAILQPAGYPNIYSDITTNNLWTDWRTEDSTTPYHIELGFEGTLSSNQSNWLEFDFYNNKIGDYDFGDKNIIFDSNDLKYGKRVNVRNVINNQTDPNKGRVDMNDVPAKLSPGYNQWVPYASGTLIIGTEPLAELTKDDLVDMKDFSVIANDWGKTGTNLAGDIYGPLGIPDGKVDFYDLMAFGSDWLQ